MNCPPLGTIRAGIRTQVPRLVQHLHLWTVRSGLCQPLDLFSLPDQLSTAGLSPDLTAIPTLSYITFSQRSRQWVLPVKFKYRLFFPLPALRLGCLQSRTFSEAVTGGKARRPHVGWRVGEPISQDYKR